MIVNIETNIYLCYV